MSIKKSMHENKDEILNSLPTQELKDSFLADLDKVEEISKPSVEEQVKEAKASEHNSDEHYDNLKNELERPTSFKMSEEEEKAAIEEALKNPPRSEDTEKE